MSGRLGRVLQFHQRLYQLLGFHGIPLPGDKSPSRIRTRLRAWSLCLLVSLSALILVCLITDDVYLYQEDMFGTANDAIKYVFAELAILAIYLEALWSYRPLAHFWWLHGKLTHRVGVVSLRSELLQCRRYLICLYGTMLFELLVHLVVWQVQAPNRHLALFWCTYEPLACLTYMRNVQFVFHMELLREQLAHLERELGLLAHYSKFACETGRSFPGFEAFLRRSLLQKQRIYSDVYDMFRCFQGAFQFSILAVLLMINIRIAVDCYFMYYTIYNNIDFLDYYFILPALLEVAAFIYASQSCMAIVPRIVHQLHNIVSDSGCCSCPDLSLQIQNFSLQLLHQSIRIDCLGLTILDSRLLTRIACSVGSYMIYTIQFIPKLSKKP